MWHHDDEEENNDWELVEEDTLEEDAIMVASPVRRGWCHSNRSASNARPSTSEFNIDPRFLQRPDHLASTPAGPIGPLDYMPTPLSEFVVKKAGQKKKNEWELL